MHNLHLIMVNADSAQDAASNVEDAINDWGNENNWRRIGGIASEDGTDDIDNHDDARWDLSFLDEEEGVTKEGTYFSRAVAYIRSMTEGPIRLRDMPTNYPDVDSAVAALCEMLRGFKVDADNNNKYKLFQVSRNFRHIHEFAINNNADKEGLVPSEFYAWEFDEFGFTDLSNEYEGKKVYIVFLDMHS